MICTIIYIRTQYLYTNGGKFIINLFRMFALHVLLYCANSSGSLQTSSLSAVADGRRGIGPDSLNGTRFIVDSLFRTSKNGYTTQRRIWSFKLFVCIHTVGVEDRPVRHSGIVCSFSE